MRANGVGRRRQGGNVRCFAVRGMSKATESHGNAWAGHATAMLGVAVARQSRDGDGMGWQRCAAAMRGVTAQWVATALRTDAAAEQWEAWHTDGNAPQGIAAALLRKATQQKCVARYGHGIEKPSAAGERHWLAWPRLSVAERRGGKGMQGRGRARPRWARQGQGIAPLRSAADLRRAHREAWRRHGRAKIRAGKAKQGEATAWRGVAVAAHGRMQQGRGKAERWVAKAKRWLAWRWQGQAEQGERWRSAGQLRAAGRRRGAGQHREAKAYQGIAGHGRGMALHRGAAARQGRALAWHSTTWPGRGRARRCGGKAKQDVARAMHGKRCEGKAQGCCGTALHSHGKAQGCCGIASVRLAGALRGFAWRRHCRERHATRWHRTA